MHREPVAQRHAQNVRIEISDPVTVVAGRVRGAFGSVSVSRFISKGKTAHRVVSRACGGRDS